MDHTPKYKYVICGLVQLHGAVKFVDCPVIDSFYMSGDPVRAVTEEGVFNFQKRDIQLLKAYMRAIRSANPNLQNLEESIEYNEILE